MARLHVLSLITPGATEVDAITDDPEDEMFLAAAIEGTAYYIVSGDSHLLGLGSYRNIPIIRPADFHSLLPDL